MTHFTREQVLAEVSRIEELLEAGRLYPSPRLSRPNRQEYATARALEKRQPGVAMPMVPRPKQVLRGPGGQCECGCWIGQHRWGDSACPNPRWKCGNGQSQWLTTSFRVFTGNPPAHFGG